MTVSTGKLADPEWRRSRAVAAGKARSSPDYHIKQLVDSFPPLTAEQLARLAQLLHDALAGEAS